MKKIFGTASHFWRKGTTDYSRKRTKSGSDNWKPTASYDELKHCELVIERALREEGIAKTKDEFMYWAKMLEKYKSRRDRIREELERIES